VEVRAAHTLTELGMLPDDWKILSISDLRPFVTSGSRGWAAFYADSGAPFIRISNLSRENIHPNLDDLRFVSLPDSDREGARTQLHAGDVLVSITADIGIVGYVTREIPVPSYINQHIALVRFDPTRISSLFVSYFLASERPQKLFRALTDAGAKAGMNLTTVASVRLALPPTLAEQEAIAEALSDADALIESLEQLLAKKRHIKQGAMQELLTGKKRLPGFEGEWSLKSLGEIGECVAGLTYAPGDVKSDGLLVLRASNVFEGKLRFEDNVYVQMEVPQRVFVEVGDILICVRNGSRDLIGKCAKIDSRARGMVFGAFMAVFRTPFNDFVYHQFQSEGIKRQIGEHLGATINQITNGSLRSFRIPFPHDAAERASVAEVLSDMDEELTVLEAKLGKARQIKLGMTQELLTGRVRLILESVRGCREPSSSDGKSVYGTATRTASPVVTSISR
jgi:type I restriction enzyme S subunit